MADFEIIEAFIRDSRTGKKPKTGENSTQNSVVEGHQPC